MNTLYTLAAAGYNCQDTNYSAYGEGDYGTCTNAAAASTTAPGVPNTGFLQQFADGGAFSIILPLFIAVVLTIASMIAVSKKRKKLVARTTDQQ